MKYFTTLLFLILLNGYSYAQTCNNLANLCELAIPINSFPIEDRLPEDINNGGGLLGCPGGFAFHNTVWYEFEAASTVIDISFVPSLCQNFAGFQVGIFQDCGSGLTPLSIQCPCTVDPVVLGASNLTIGERYFIVLDGCSGDVCNYRMDLVNGAINPIIDSIGTIDTITASMNPVCPGEVINLSVPQVNAATDYVWLFPGNVVPLNVSCNQATIIINSGPADIYVSAINGSDTILSDPLTLEVSSFESFDTVSYCSILQQGYTDPAGNIFPAGNWDIPMFTARGCDSLIHLTVLEYDELPDITLTVNNESCDGVDDGSASLVINNPGIGPFTINWSNGVSNEDSIADLSPGTYLVEVMAEGGCFVLDTFEVLSSFDLTVESTPVDCDTLNGTATASVAGGSPNFIFEWSNGVTGASIDGLSPGGYSVTATDQSTNCRTHRNVYVDYDSSCVSYISGYVFNDDLLQTCVAPLPGLANVMVFLNNGQATMTDSTGYYEFQVDLDAYTIVLNLTTTYEPVCATPITVDASTPGVYSDNNFFLKYNPNRDVQLKVSKPNPRPGFNRTVRICLMNIGAQTMDGTLTFVHDEMQDFISSDIPITNYDSTTNTITWDYSGLPPGSIWVYRVTMYTPLSVPVGETIDYYFLADPVQGDLTPDNNEWSCSLITTNAYDPNDKQVMPMGAGPEGFISKSDTLLSYQVRFQNTGTDTAYTVVIRDTLDVNLDVKTIRPGPSSHTYELDILNGNVLEFTFNNIYLPDSTIDLEGSNGFVFFDIELLQNLPEETEIRNKAAIYFDFNPPIITNEVLNTIELIVGTESPIENDLNANVFPNPSKRDATLILNLMEEGIYEIQIRDILGRVVQQVQAAQLMNLGEHAIPLNMSEAESGLYLITILNNQNQSKSLKWLKI